MQLPPIPPILSPCKFYIIRLPLSVHTCQNFLIKNVVISINPNLIHLHRNYFQFFPFSPKFFFKIYFLNVLYSLFLSWLFRELGLTVQFLDLAGARTGVPLLLPGKLVDVCHANHPTVLAQQNGAVTAYTSLDTATNPVSDKRHNWRQTS